MVRRLLWIGAAAAVLGACSHRHSDEGEAAPAVDQGWTLTIINHHWLDVSIYVTTDGQRSHVGFVTATQTVSFDMPARTIAAGRLITLVADPVGGPRSVQSERLAVQGGQSVEWTLEHGLERSTVAVY
jgi:hypothetical protein